MFPRSTRQRRAEACEARGARRDPSTKSRTRICRPKTTITEHDVRFCTLFIPGVVLRNGLRRTAKTTFDLWVSRNDPGWVICDHGQLRRIFLHGVKPIAEIAKARDNVAMSWSV